MSMSISNTYGYGFSIPKDKDKVMDFILRHRNFFAENEDEVNLIQKLANIAKEPFELEDIDTLCDDYLKDYSYRNAYGAVIATIMSRETGIDFTYQPGDDYDDSSCIMLEEKYPWNFTEAEKSLTESALFDICKKYMDQLGLNEDPDYISVTYCG